MVGVFFWQNPDIDTNETYFVMKQFRIIFVWKLSYHDIKSTEIPPLENSFILDDWVNYEMIKKITDGFQMNVCMYMYIYIELLKDKVIKCEINPILYVNHHLSFVPIYSNSLKALWDTGNYFIISYISYNVLILIWSALTGNIL